MMRIVNKYHAVDNRLSRSAYDPMIAAKSSVNILLWVAASITVALYVLYKSSKTYPFSDLRRLIM